MSIEDLLRTGGAIAILAAIVLAFYGNRVQTTAAADARLAEVNRHWEARFNDERESKEAWKAQAQQLAPTLEQIAEELNAANLRDEEWKKALLGQGTGPIDRRGAT